MSFRHPQQSLVGRHRRYILWTEVDRHTGKECTKVISMSFLQFHKRFGRRCCELFGRRRFKSCVAEVSPRGEQERGRIRAANRHRVAVNLHLAAVRDELQAGHELHARLLVGVIELSTHDEPVLGCDGFGRFRTRQLHRERHAAWMVGGNPAHQHLVGIAGECFPHKMGVTHAVADPRDRIVEREFTAIIGCRFVAGKIKSEIAERCVRAEGTILAPQADLRVIGELLRFGVFAGE